MALPPSPIDAADGAGSGPDAGRTPAPAAVVASLRRMLDSDELRSAPQSRRFLAYVVTETLSGRGHRLKERTVARNALGRTKDFDAATDAAARVQATRLRTSMQRYYAGTGASESLVIDLPRGSYVPVFAYRDPAPPPARDTPLEPGLLVVQFADSPSPGADRPMAEALTESLVHALAAFPALRVVGPAVSERGGGAGVDARAAARAVNVQYVLTGRIRTTEAQLRIMIRLSDGESGEVLWSDVWDQDRATVSGFQDEDDLIRRIAATVGDFRGVVLRDATVRRPGPDSEGAHDAVLSYFRYLDNGSRDAAEIAAQELSASLELDPENAILLSMLGNVQYARAILGWAADRDAALAEAQRSARTALAVRPGYGLAWTVLAGVAYARGNVDECLTNARQAIELSPSHPSTLYASGVLLALGGAWDAGLQCIRESNRLNPYHPGYQHVYLALDRLMASDHAGMLAEASLHTHPEDLWGPLTRFLALAGMSDDWARGELDAALAIEPDLFTDDAALIEHMQDVPSEVRDAIRERLLEWRSAHPDYGQRA